MIDAVVHFSASGFSAYMHISSYYEMLIVGRVFSPCKHFLIISQQKKAVQKTKSLQSQSGFEQLLHISLDLSPEEDEELRKLCARYVFDNQ